MFWVLSMDTSGVVPVSQVTTFMTDASPTNNITTNSQIVEYVYVTDNSIFMSGTNALISSTYFGDVMAEQQTYGWKPSAISVRQQAVKLAFIPRSQSAEIDAVRLYSTDLSAVHIRLPRNVFYVAVNQNKLYAFTEETAYIYSMDGSLDRQFSLDTKVTRIKQLSDQVVVLWDSQKSYIMQLT
jgi:hypothetical protein